MLKPSLGAFSVRELVVVVVVVVVVVLELIGRWAVGEEEEER